MPVLPFLKYLTHFFCFFSAFSASLGCWYSPNIIPLLCEWPEVITQANISDDLSVTASFIWHWSQCVSKYRSVLEDIYTRTVAISKHDEQALLPSTSWRIHQNQNVFHRENTKGLTYWKGTLSTFSDQFLCLSSPSCLHSSPLQLQVAIPHSMLSPAACPQKNSSCTVLHAQEGFSALR